MNCQYSPKGVCSKKIEFLLEDGVVKNIRFEGGCHGNLQGLSKLAEGREAAEVIDKLKGICCGRKKTSCPDQLARALKKALAGAKGTVKPK